MVCGVLDAVCCTCRRLIDLCCVYTCRRLIGLSDCRYDATLNMHVGNQYAVTYIEYDDNGLVNLDDLQVDEAWLAFEYSTSYVAPRVYGEYELEEEDDNGFDR